MSRHEQRALLDRIHIVDDEVALDALLHNILAAQKSLTIAFLNQHAFNLYGRDSAFRQAFANADIVLRDGIGLSMALRALGLPAGLNMNGTDFIPVLARQFSERLPQCGVHAYGTAAPWLERGAEILFENFDTAPVLCDGFSAIETYTHYLQQDSRATKLVILAMGMPKQEIAAAALKQAAGNGAVIVCGGAILDFCAGRVPRAPRWVRALRMEWLFRLAMEPRRLFSRYVAGGIIFLKTVVMLAFEERALAKRVAPVKTNP